MIYEITGDVRFYVDISLWCKSEIIYIKSGEKTAVVDNEEHNDLKKIDENWYWLGGNRINSN